jgi:hypothetical protein
MRDGEPVRPESLDEIRERTASQLEAIPQHLRLATGNVEPYPVSYSDRLRQATGV